MNSEFSFSKTSCLTKAEELSLSYYLPIAGGRIIGFIPFPRILKRNIKNILVLDETEKAQQQELKKKFGEINQKNTSERRKTKKIPRQDQTIETKQDVPKQRKKFYQQLRREWAKPYQQPDTREARRFWSKIWERKDHNKKKWINNTETFANARKRPSGEHTP